MRTAAETEEFGAALARALAARENAPTIVYLSGELGAGKTTLARGFLCGCGFQGVIRSPTYTFLECYELSDHTVVHLDLFRLTEPSGLESLGARELARPGHVWLVEWPERAAGLLPPPDLAIALQVRPAGHALRASPHSEFGRSWLHTLVELRGE
jgi:tRNA threonylcarbamoyladenosine biosynthesis protein TsaE